MTLLLVSIGCCLGVFTLTRIISTIISKRRCQAEAARRGCKPAPALTSWGFLGLAPILDHLKATREERGPQQFVKYLDELGIRGSIHTARVEGNSVLSSIKRALEFDRDSVGLRSAGDKGSGECEGSFQFKL